MANRAAVEIAPFGPEPKTLPAPELRGHTADGTVVEMPLAHTSVRARVSGSIARVEVQQLFQNPGTSRLEAVYKFPLPENAAVIEMLFRIRDRVVIGEIRPRGEAREVYEQAKSEGKTAALTEQERPNLFTQSVANIPPGESVEVVLRYVHEIPFDDGRYRFVFPTTIGPRYMPASKIAEAAPITIGVLPQGMRAAHDVDIAVELSPASAFAEIGARSHRIVTGADGGRRIVTLAGDDRIPNKDFILQWRPAHPEPDARAIVGEEKNARWMMLFVQPPAEVRKGQVRPKEVVFLLDKSGSMMGEPIETAKKVIEKTLTTMGPRDTFRLLAFDSSVEAMSPEPLSPTDENRKAAGHYLARLSGGGGTEMLRGIQAVLDLPPVDPGRLRVVVFATDGFIGNEAEIIKHIEAGRGQTRVFGFGIGSSVNRYLIEGVARAGRGVADYVRQGESPDVAVERLHRRLDQPLLTDLDMQFEGFHVRDMQPSRLPDLFAGQPLVIVGKVDGAAQNGASVVLRGKLGEAAWERRIPLAASREDGELLGTLWARRRIGELVDGGEYGRVSKEAETEVTALGMTRHLVTPYTSFVAVERTLKANLQIPLMQVLVPNALPEGVSHDGVFGAASVTAEVTPMRVKPGDPEIRVHAPASSRVEVRLPWSRRPLAAVYDAPTREHVARFVVPSGWPDGSWQAQVAVMSPDGSRIERAATLRVDTRAAPVVVVELPAARRGKKLRIGVKPALPLSAMAPLASAEGGWAAAVRGAMEVKEVLVRAPWGEVASAEMDGPLGVWRATLDVPADAPQVTSLEIVAVDAAGNVSRRQVPVEIADDEVRATSLAGAALALFALVVLARLVRRKK
jgi:Ca-activated chloride channel family protein